VTRPVARLPRTAGGDFGLDLGAARWVMDAGEGGHSGWRHDTCSGGCLGLLMPMTALIF
jgi:hypothetical protein